MHRMKMNEQRVGARARRAVLAVWFVALSEACGGVASTPSVGSESHFLAHCDGVCGGGLECIGGICTRPCLTDGASCSELGSSAACTNASVEPGQVAVCDVSCIDTSGCVALGRSYTCDGGFCRTGVSGRAMSGAALPNEAVPELPLADAGMGCVGPTCSECPAPPFGLMSGPPTDWARHPETGVCCEYVGTFNVPLGWPVFFTRAECETDCRCSVLERYREGVGYTTDRSTLECRCAGGECPATPEQAVESVCRPGRSAYRREGCGLIAIAENNPTYGDGWVFTVGAGSTPSLVGAYSYSDVPRYPCQTYGSIAGREFECEGAVECQLCGEAFDAPLPSCD